MWSGGLDIPAAASGSATDRTGLEAEEERLKAEWSALREESSQLGNEELGEDGDATRARRTADADDSYARGDYDQSVDRARAREQDVEAQRNKREEFVNREIKALSDQLKVSEEKLRAVWDMAYFYQWKFKWDLESAVRQAVVEVIAEDENRRAEIIRAICALFIKFSDAMLGTRIGSASGVPESKIYLRLPEPIQNRAVEQQAIATSQQRDHDAQAAQFKRVEADKFYDEQVAKAEGELAKAEGERGEMESEYESAEARKKRVEAEFLAHRSRFHAVQEQMKAISDRMENIREQIDELPPGSPPTV